MDKEGQLQLVHAETEYIRDDEAQVSDMAVSEGMLATIWRCLFRVSIATHLTDLSIGMVPCASTTCATQRTL